MDVTQVAEGSHLGRIAADTALFIGGFTVVFVLLGLTATRVGKTVFANHALLNRVQG